MSPRTLDSHHSKNERRSGMQAPHCPLTGNTAFTFFVLARASAGPELCHKWSLVLYGTLLGVLCAATVGYLRSGAQTAALLQSSRSWKPSKKEVCGTQSKICVEVDKALCRGAHGILPVRGHDHASWVKLPACHHHRHQFGQPVPISDPGLCRPLVFWCRTSTR